MAPRRLRIGSPIPHRKSRIEIIPLIDIMFFLLASFMMVSLQMSKTENLRVELPLASQATPDFQPGMINIAVDKAGRTFFEKQQLDAGQLVTVISNRIRLETNTPVTISGDLQTEHGAMVDVYDLVRSLGVQKVSFCVMPGNPGPEGSAP